MESFRRRLGQFSIQRHEIRRQGFKLLPLFGRFIVVDCRFDYSADAMLYTALSPDFDEIPEGEKPPTYEWMCITTNRGEVSYFPKRIACS